MKTYFQRNKSANSLSKYCSCFIVLVFSFLFSSTSLFCQAEPTKVQRNQISTMDSPKVIKKSMLNKRVVLSAADSSQTPLEKINSSDLNLNNPIVKGQKSTAILRKDQPNGKNQ